jgi:hypothetical protein
MSKEFPAVGQFEIKSSGEPGGRDGLVAVNLTLAALLSTGRRSSLAGGGVNSSPGQQAMAANSFPFSG